LQTVFDKGGGYSTIGTARSALALVATTCSLPNVGENILVTRFLRGVSKKRPPIPKYDTMWDPRNVLDYLSTLEPLCSLSLTDLTLKLVGLLALATGQRVQTLCGIEVSKILEKDFGYEVFISKQLKTYKPGRDQPCLVLPRFDTNPTWCVSRTLKEYLERTKEFRSNTDQLLLITRPPYRPVNSQTVSKWIKKILSSSGIDTQIFSAHSTRHAATSTAAKLGVTVDQIRSRAGWTEHSNVFARFYHRPIDDRQSFAKAVFASAK